MTPEILKDETTRYALPLPVREPILAVGADMASRPGLAMGDACLLAPPLGDLKDAENHRRFVEQVDELRKTCDEPPRLVAHDLHPNYISTAFARSMEGVQAYPVQHHEAHVAAALAHFSIVGDVIGIAYDGTGYGTDGAIWGGELFVGSAAAFRRVAHLQYVPMPGGEAAIRSPWRMAVAHARHAFGPAFRKADVPHFVYISDADIDEIVQVCSAPDLSPPTSSVGRLFDAVAVLCGLLAEGGPHLPAQLEALADPDVQDQYAPAVLTFDEGHLIDTAGLIRDVVADMLLDTPAAVVAARFHNSLAEATAEVCERVAVQHGLRTVVLSGGVFCNRFLVQRLTANLRQRGLEVYAMPPELAGDVSIALGQAAIVSERTR